MTHSVHIEPYNIDIQVEDNTLIKEVVDNSGIDFSCGGNGICGNCLVELIYGNPEMSKAEKALLKKKGLDGANWRIACLSRITGDISIRIPDRKPSILSDRKNTRNKGEEGFSIAVDLGSTTIVAQLLDRMSGTIKESLSEINIQSSYGADIISRIAYAIQSRENSERLTALIRNQIGKMISEMTMHSYKESIRQVTIVGNSVMHHLFCGLDVTPFAACPFQSAHNGRVDFSPSELNWTLPEDCRISFMPNISHFVGSDILAGIYKLGIHNKKKWTALIDLGTNGEIVIGRKGTIVCTSTAAGPAFEGINITDGMRAASGAVYRVDETTGKVRTIGNVYPSGICGSGLIDAIHYFLKTGQITSDGRIADDSLKCLNISDHVYLYDRDIREFQLAKAAIATGFELLLRHIGITLSDIDTIHIAGGLGTWLDIKKAREIGLVKADVSTKILKAGNSALAGCKELTFPTAEKESEEIISMLSHYSLETDERFQDVYCDNLYF